eukprot:194624_1
MADDSQQLMLQLVSASTCEKPLNWKKIGNTLQNSLFFAMPNRMEQKSKLVTLFKTYCDDNNEQMIGEHFKSQLCQAYYNNNDKSFMFYDILANKLHYSLNKRHQFYHVLLHQYLKLSDLNKQNIIQILFRRCIIACQKGKDININDIKN